MVSWKELLYSKPSKHLNVVYLLLEMLHQGWTARLLVYKFFIFARSADLFFTVYHTRNELELINWKCNVWTQLVPNEEVIITKIIQKLSFIVCENILGFF